MNDTSDSFEEKTNSNKAFKIIKGTIGIVGGDKIEKSVDLVSELIGLQLDLLEAVNTKLTRMIKANFNVGLSNLQDSCHLKGKNRVDSIKEAIQI